MLTLGNNGQTLALTGYNRALGGTGGLNSTTSAAVNRTVALVNGQGAANFTLLNDFASGNNPRSAYTTNGTDIWAVGGAGGLRYTTAGSTTSTQVSDTVLNLRTVTVAGGQLYVSGASGSAVRVGAVGTGTPTTSGQTITNLPGFPTANSPYQFVLARVGNPSFAGPNVLYVAEDQASGGQILKYTFDGTTWTAQGEVGAAAVRGLTGVVTGDNQVTLYGTTGGSAAAGGGSIYTFTDTAAAAGTISGTATTLGTGAPGNISYRGIAFAPANLVWNDAASGAWNLTNTNWTNTAPTTPVAGQAFVNAYAANFGNITQNNAVTVGAGVNPAAVNVTNAANTYTFTNASGDLGIQGLGRLTKSGNGTLILASPNTYSGGTLLTGGTLLANNTTGSATGRGAVTVNGGTLGGTGTIAGAVTVNTGGTIQAGNANGVGTLTLNGGLNLTAGARTTFRITDGSTPSATPGGSTIGTIPNPTSNNFVDITNGGLNVAQPDIPTLQFVINGTGTTFAIEQAYSYRVGRVFNNGQPEDLSAVQLSSTLFPNMFSAVGFQATNFTLSGDTQGNLYVGFTPVPEPATVLGVAAAVLGVGGLIRRRSRGKANEAVTAA
jgi:autotransporter-associated beta strand protein